MRLPGNSGDSIAEHMRVRISHLVNSLTRQALFETVPGYVSKEVDFESMERDARRMYAIERLRRFHLGENASQLLCAS